MNSPISSDKNIKSWRKAARGRLRLELAGLSFALSKGFSPEDYARHLWGKGALNWIKKTRPGAAEYLLKEARAFQEFYPEVVFEVVETGDEKAELVFTGGCLGGWGRDHWAVARSLGLTQQDICAYCGEAFRVWAEPLGLDVSIGPENGANCRLRVTRH
ncbi:MAG: hypothetical protein Q8Q07_02555 [Dehalococcoidales bacterium]|nr:hypothetical protein [Dehalococcoidales bacterium]MDZ4230581.1 hypothetical protein [Dehalococcoidales bacterium]